MRANVRGLAKALRKVRPDPHDLVTAGEYLGWENAVYAVADALFTDTTAFTKLAGVVSEDARRIF